MKLTVRTKDIVDALIPQIKYKGNSINFQLSDDRLNISSNELLLITANIPIIKKEGTLDSDISFNILSTINMLDEDCEYTELSIIKDVKATLIVTQGDLLELRYTESYDKRVEIDSSSLNMLGEMSSEELSNINKLSDNFTSIAKVLKKGNPPLKFINNKVYICYSNSVIVTSTTGILDNKIINNVALKSLSKLASVSKEKTLVFYDCTVTSSIVVALGVFKVRIPYKIVKDTLHDEIDTTISNNLPNKTLLCKQVLLSSKSIILHLKSTKCVLSISDNSLSVLANTNVGHSILIGSTKTRDTFTINVMTEQLNALIKTFENSKGEITFKDGRNLICLRTGNTTILLAGLTMMI